MSCTSCVYLFSDAFLLVSSTTSWYFGAEEEYNNKTLKPTFFAVSTLYSSPEVVISLTDPNKVAVDSESLPPLLAKHFQGN